MSQRPAVDRCFVVRAARTCAAAWVVAFAVAPAALAAPIMPVAPDYGWLFDEGSGSLVGATWGGATGTLMGDAGFSSDVPTGFGYAGNHSLLLDGTGDFAEVGSLTGVLNGSTGIALSAWIRSDGTGQDRAFFSGADPGNEDTFGARYDQSGWLNGNGGTTDLIKLSLLIDDGSGATNYQYESGSGYQTTLWQHVLFTWSAGSGAQLYVNGVLDTPSEISTGFDTVGGALAGQTRFLIGNGPKDVWQGRIDEVMVWNQGLSAGNAEWLATNSMSVTAVPEPGTALLFGLGLALLSPFGRFARCGRRPRA